MKSFAQYLTENQTKINESSITKLVRRHSPTVVLDKLMEIMDRRDVEDIVSMHVRNFRPNKSSDDYAQDMINQYNGDVKGVIKIFSDEMDRGTYNAFLEQF